MGLLVNTFIHVWRNCILVPDEPGKHFWGKKQKIAISFGVWAKEHQTFSRSFMAVLSNMQFRHPDEPSQDETSVQ